ncbi:hypothetical protein [Leptothoe spongobia]|uniref:Uncharacterized protein n=1 Tax=Leptothoe spongobia TAU-MAC 1115 TaxID=1967444 RepID=A0A947DCG9_9CYAN|nr:hypothetical protein [Leptothoe spongobia]MBT9314507.1 hypothetical protein [Leptothoe spongobia TAU-MAC 1115]
MPSIQLGNNLGLAPPRAKPSLQPMAPSSSSIADLPAENLINQGDQGDQSELQPQGEIQTEFSFELPIGYVDAMGQSHRRGMMRLARTVDEIAPMSDPRVQANPAYATVIILSQVILSLGTLPDVSPVVIENMFAGDLNYLQNFYLKINRLEE